MLRFSANLGFLWSDLPLLDRIDRAAAAGFPAVELHWPYDTPARDVRAACARHGLTLLGINTVRGNPGENGLGALPGREDEFQAAIDQSLAFCAGSGATAIHAMAGIVPPGDRARGRDTLCRNLETAARKASAQGVTLLLEALNPNDAPGYFYATQGEAAAVIEAVGAPNLRLMFDTYHVGRAEGDVLTRLERYWPLIGHIQIAGVPARAEPDAGELYYPAIFARIDALGYAGFIGCEYRPRGTVEQGLSWTKTLGVTLNGAGR